MLAKMRRNSAKSVACVLVRLISGTSAVCKRRGGASAFIDKSASWKQTKRKTKEKLKKDAQPHISKPFLASQRAKEAQAQAHMSKVWTQLDNDEEFQQELQSAYQSLDSETQKAYIFEPELRWNEIDDAGLLAKLNTLAMEHKQRCIPSIEVPENAIEAAESFISVEEYNTMLKVYAARGKYADANALLLRMEQNLLPVDTERLHLFTAGSRNHVDEKKESSASDTNLNLLMELEKLPHVIPPNNRSYVFYINALAASKQRDAAATAVRTLGRMKAYGILPDIPAYTSVMNVCAKSDKLHWAYKILDKMQLAGLVPTSASFTVLINASIAKNDLDKAFETFHLMRTHVTEPDVFAFTTLIHGYAKHGRVERALNLMEDLLEAGLTPTELTFNVLINACAKSRYFAHKAIDFYHEMQEMYDYLPDMYTYNTVLSACAMQGDVLQAEVILRQMAKHQVPYDHITYTTLLRLYGRANVRRIVDLQPRNMKPFRPLEPIRQDPTEYDDETGRELSGSIRSALKGYEVNEDSDDEDAEELEELEDEDERELQAIREKDARMALELQTASIHSPERELLDEFDIANLPMNLTHFGRFQAENIKKAERLFEEMLQVDGMKITAITLNTMLNVYAEALHLRRAEAFWKERFPALNCRSDHYTYRVLMQMYVRARKTEIAERLLWDEIEPKIESEEIQADGIVYGLVVDHYARFQKIRKALVVLEAADRRGLAIPEKYFKKIRRVTEKMGIYTELIPEDPKIEMKAGTRSQLMKKRQVRAEVLAYNRKKGKKYILPQR
uniref:Uncharacterized protein AlNc14C86G5497 n=1 Tax=Albugo laibachii Nc14 TaxID=890382 RepID=F0WFW2_9STRA|nr:conserved hypothetical protein [Albugo laibachii Nc14]|eukprot:CCA20096.1 conserved hypothetical protein [Albugo laibachii Nc14]